MAAIQPADTQGLQLLKEMIAKGEYLFDSSQAKEAAKALNIPDKQLNKVLSKLTAGGWLLRLRRGLYAGTGTLPGSIQIHPFAIATRLVEPAAISHWSAMQHHGFTEQIPQTIMATTPKKMVTPTMRAGTAKTNLKHAWQILGIRYEYINIKPKYYFGIEEVWVDEHFRVPITDKERTLLDGFIYPSMFGGMGEILSILETHLHEIDVKKLVAYALRYNIKSLAKRLGWSLEYFGVAQSYLKPLIVIPINNYCKLDPAQLARGTYDTRWMILNNLVK